VERKWFTPEEANALLPRLKEELEVLQRLVLSIERRFAELRRIKTASSHAAGERTQGNDPFFELESQLEFMRMEADMLVGNFARKGVQLKMLDPALLDFPALLDGEPVLLCWREGEDEVVHYHGWNDGFAGRRPLPEDWK